MIAQSLEVKLVLLLVTHECVGYGVWGIGGWSGEGWKLEGGVRGSVKWVETIIICGKPVYRF